MADARHQAPSSLRARFGEHGYLNAVQVSSNLDAAKRETDMLFPSYTDHNGGSGDLISGGIGRRTAVFKDSTLAIIKPHAVHAGLWRHGI